MRAKVITWQELAEVFSIVDGELYRKVFRGIKLNIPRRVPTTGKGVYINVSFNGSGYRYHRVLYMVAHKVTLKPEQLIDHIIADNKHDNRLCNLQILTNADNRRKDVVYKLPKIRGGAYSLYLNIQMDSHYIASFKTPASYWEAHKLMLELFSVGTKGLAHVQSISADKKAVKAYLKAPFKQLKGK